MIGRVELQDCHNVRYLKLSCLISIRTIFLAIWKIDLCCFADHSTPHTADNTISLSVLTHYLENLFKISRYTETFQ